jgi:hypothetical protein
VGGNETCGGGSGGCAGDATVFCGDEVSQADLRSSILASQPDMAEGLFPYEVGSAQLDRAGLPNNKRWENLG